MITVTFEGKKAAVIDDATDPARLLEATPEIAKMFEEFREDGVPVMAPGPKIEGALTDNVEQSKLLESFLVALENIGYDFTRSKS